MTALAHQPQPEPLGTTESPYRAGDRVQILYMSERGTILADAYVSAVFPRRDGSYGITAVMSDARASFHLVPATGHAKTIAPGTGRVIIGVDHTKPSE